jgi:hypothetical protein
MLVILILMCASFASSVLAAKYGGVINTLDNSDKPMYAAERISVVINNQPVYFPDVNPEIKAGRTLVPNESSF